MTQQELIIEYIRENGSIVPARLGDRDRAFRGGWIGSEAGKRCRELRKRGVLTGVKDGRYERFYLSGYAPVSETVKRFFEDFPVREEPMKLGTLW